MYKTTRKAYGPFGLGKYDVDLATEVYIGALTIGVSVQAIMQAFYDGAIDASVDAKCLKNIAKQIRLQ